MKILDCSYHRNGVGGTPFFVSIFQEDQDRDCKGKTMLAIQFDVKDEVCTAVFDFDLLKQGNIQFMENSWRGDHFHENLKKLVPPIWHKKMDEAAEAIAAELAEE